MINGKADTRGFTLLELMITVAILGILAAIAIPAYNGYITTAKMAEAETNLAAIRLAEEEYFLENNEYFTGADYSQIASNSGNLWTRSRGSEGYSFDYEVTSGSVSTTWTAKATGNTGAVNGKTVTVIK